jgi:hypothetical protein
LAKSASSMGTECRVAANGNRPKASCTEFYKLNNGSPVERYTSEMLILVASKRGAHDLHGGNTQESTATSIGTASQTLEAKKHESTMNNSYEDDFSAADFSVAYVTYGLIFEMEILGTIRRGTLSQSTMNLPFFVILPRLGQPFPL